MLNRLKKTCVALAAVSAIALPVHSASAEQATVVGRVIDGQVYELQPNAGTPMSFQAARASGTPMVIRNDVNENIPLSIPSNLIPVAGTCSLYYPGSATSGQASPAACDAVVPRGAVLLIG